MNIAKEISTLSRSNRNKVGAVLVDKDKNIISMGFNGTPSGFDNDPEVKSNGVMVTKPEVLHAESNLITKIAKSTSSSEGSTMYVTLSCCLECSKLIIQAGIKRVVYLDEYRDLKGLSLLKKCGIKVEKIKYK